VSMIIVLGSRDSALLRYICHVRALSEDMRGLMKSRVLDFSNPLVLISLSQLTLSMAFTLTDPILPLYASSFNISYTLVGLVMSSFGFTRIFCEIPGGLLMNRIGRKSLLIIGFVVSSISQVIAGVAQSYIELAISRMMIGVGSALELTASLTLIGDMSTKEDRQRNIARYQGAATSAQIIGPIIGGVISDIAGLRSIFFISALLCAIGVLVVSRIRIQDESKLDKSKSLVPAAFDFKRTLGDLRVVAVSASAFAMFLLFSSIRGTMIPLYGAGVLDLNSTEIGLIFSCTSLTIFLVLFFVTNRLERVFGRARLLSISLLVCSLAVLTISLSSDFTTFVIASIPLGVGFGLLQPIPFAMIIDLSEPVNRGLMMGTLRTIADLGIIIGPTSVGWLMSLDQPLWVFYLISAIVGAFSLLTWTVFRRPRKDD